MTLKLGRTFGWWKFTLSVGPPSKKVTMRTYSHPVRPPSRGDFGPGGAAGPSRPGAPTRTGEDSRGVPGPPRAPRQPPTLQDPAGTPGPLPCLSIRALWGTQSPVHGEGQGGWTSQSAVPDQHSGQRYIRVHVLLHVAYDAGGLPPPGDRHP